MHTFTKYLSIEYTRTKIMHNLRQVNVAHTLQKTEIISALSLISYNIPELTISILFFSNENEEKNR